MCAKILTLIKRQLRAAAEGRGTEPVDTPATGVQNVVRCHFSAGEMAWKMREERRAPTGV